MVSSMFKRRLFSSCFSFVFLCFLLFSSLAFSQVRKCDPVDWDDDGVDNIYELDHGYDPFEPLSASNSHGRAFILESVNSVGGIELPEPDRFKADDSFIVEFWYSPVAPATGSFFEYEDSNGTYSISVNAAVVEAEFYGVTLSSGSALGSHKITARADDAKWVHIAFVSKHNGTDLDLALLVDGEIIAEQSNVAVPASVPAIKATLANGFTAGYFDEFRFWESARLASLANLFLIR